MKKFFSFIGLLLLALISQATTYTVDSTVGAGAQFSDIASAINAASAGDTILVHSSQYSYGTVYINKSVVLIGPGHRPTVNQNLAASVATFILINGGSGATIEGFVIGNIEGALWNIVNDVKIKNNYFNGYALVAGCYGDGSGSDNWLFEGNVFAQSVGCSGCEIIDLRNSPAGNDNWTFRNNYFQGDGGGNVFIANANSTTVFSNNIICHNNGVNLFDVSSNALIENNIFWVTSAFTNVAVGCTNCTFNNNLFYSPSATLDVVAGVGNVMNANPQFTTLQDGLINWNYNNDYHLNSGSPAAGSAADGGDMGIYGADYNFRMNGYTNDIPRMTEALPQYIVVPVNGTFTIDFSATGAGH